MEVLVSIITPAYNAAAYLGETIKSVQAQTHQDWELLIVDDGSTDATFKVAQNYAAADIRIKVVSQANLGQAGARNHALKQAQGKWIAFLDADDLWEPIKLERQLALSKTMPDVDLIYTSGYKFTDNNLTQPDSYNIIGGRFEAMDMYNALFINNDIPILSVLLKTELVAKVGLQDDARSVQGCEDWDYWLRIALSGGIFYGLHERLFYYRKHGASTSANVIKMGQAQITILVKNYRSNYFSSLGTRRIFIPLLNYLVTLLVKQNRKADAVALVQKCNSVLPLFSKVYRLFLPVVNKHTIGIFELTNRVYRKVLPSKKRSR